MPSPAAEIAATESNAATVLQKPMWVTKLENPFRLYETWFCIKSLLLAHITVIQIYCVMKGESISPRTMNTDTVEWFFGDAWQMVGGSTNKLTVTWFDQADKKASTFQHAGKREAQ